MHLLQKICKTIFVFSLAFITFMLLCIYEELYTKNKVFIFRYNFMFYRKINVFHEPQYIKDYENGHQLHILHFLSFKKITL